MYGGYELHTGVKDDFIVFDYSSTHLGVPSKVKASNLSCSPGNNNLTFLFKRINKQINCEFNQ